MQLSDFRIGWRLLAKDWRWSGSAIAGLAMGFAACFLLLGYVMYSFSYDSSHLDPDRVYLVKTRFHFPGVPEEWSEQATQALRGTIRQQRLPAEVTMVGRIPAALVVDDRAVAAQVTLVDPAFATMMGVHALAGDPTAALMRPDSIVLTVTAARKLFGRDDNVVGQLVTAAGERYVVGALLADPPGASTIPFEILAGTGSTLWANEDRDDATQNWGRLFGRVYVKLHAGADPAASATALAAALQRASDASPLHQQLAPEFLAQLGDKPLMDVALVRLRDAYLDPDLARGAVLHGDRPVLYAVTALAFLILLLAAINYVNLTTVRTLRRQREIAISKVLGAPAGQVVAQFLAESVLITLAATMLGLLCAWRLMPLFGELMNRPIGTFLSVPVVAAFLALGLLTGALAGLHPAWVALRVKAAVALAGRHDQESRAGLRARRALTVLQLASAMALASVTLGVAWQTYHVLTSSPGFDARAKLVIDAGAPYTAPDARVRSFVEAVRRLPGVTGVAESLEAVGRQDIVQKGVLKHDGGTTITIEWKGISPTFLSVYGMRPLAGRIYDEQRDADSKAAGVVLTAAAARALGFAAPQDAIGRSVDGDGKDYQIVGVVPDMRFQSLREQPSPVAFRLARSTPVLTVSFQGSAAAMEAAVEAAWRQALPDKALTMTRQEALLAAHYADDVRSVKLLAASALLAIVIAAMGVYVLSAYSVQRRTREIVLHRLFGAGRGDIVRLLGRETVLLIAVSAVVGIPPALLALRHYLAGFVDQSPGWGWAIVLAFALAALVALASVLRGIAVALALRPGAALRT